jgi:hypothetical protein
VVDTCFEVCTEFSVLPLPQDTTTHVLQKLKNFKTRHSVIVHDFAETLWYHQRWKSSDDNSFSDPNPADPK